MNNTMLNEYEKCFGVKYHTERNQQLFGSLMPDGWDFVYDINDNETLVIIENKANIKQQQTAREQIVAYANIAVINKPTLSTIVCLNGFGVSKLIVDVYLFVSQRLTLTELTLNDLSNLFSHASTIVGNNGSSNDTSNDNLQTLHNLIISETKLSDTRSLSIVSAFLILTAKLPTIQNLLTLNNNSLMFHVILNEFRKYYGSDNVIDNYFNNNQQLLNLNIIKIINYIIDKNINLEAAYKQFCKYTRDIQDVNIELTPPHISDIMKHYLHTYKYDVVIDPFCGTGALIADEQPHIEKIGIEIVEFMYLMTKINMVLKNVHNFKLIHGNSREVLPDVLTTAISRQLHTPPLSVQQNINNSPPLSVQQNINSNNNSQFNSSLLPHTINTIRHVVCITNPPYTKRISGYYAIECLTWLIGYVDAIIAIIPKSNVSNRNIYNKFKQMFLSNGYYPRTIVDVGYCFQDVSETAVILVIDRLNQQQTPVNHTHQLLTLNLIPNIDYIKPPRKQKQLLPAGLAKIEAIKHGTTDASTIINSSTANGDWADASTTAVNTTDESNLELLKQQLIEQTKHQMMQQTEQIIDNFNNTNNDETLYDNAMTWCDTILTKRNEIETLMHNVVFVRFGDMFEFVATKKVMIASASVPLFGASVENKPRKLVNYYDYDVAVDDTLDGTPNNTPIFSINSTGDGACGYCFVMNELERFAISSRMLFKQIDTNVVIDATLTAQLISLWIHNVLGYSHKKGITKARFPDELVPIAINITELLIDCTTVARTHDKTVNHPF